VERHCHDAVRGIESLLHAIAMMYIDVDVENTPLEAEQLDYAKNNV
jgi:hypothetical protein